MVLLTTEGLLLRRGARDLLRVPALALREGWRLGVVGPNGSGKTSLLLALAGRFQPAEGRVLRPPGVDVALLTQAATPASRGTLWDLAEAELAGLQALARELERARPKADDPRDSGAGLRYADLLATFDQRGGFTAETRLRAGLSRVGVPEATWRRAAEQAAGGERQRARLVGALTAASDVLLLDEPSNHLDLKGRAWLVEQLQARRGAVVLASHDRALLDRVCTHLGRIEGGQLVVRRGGYAEVTQRVAGEARGRARRDAARARRVAELERMAAELATFGHRGAQARKRRAERERDALRTQAGAASASPEPAPGTAFATRSPATAPAARGGTAPRGPLLRARHLRVEGVLDDERLELSPGQRLALVGPSGSGKSTLLALIAGVRASDDMRAELAWATGTSLLYLDQVNRGLDPEASARAALEAWVAPAQAAGALAAAGLPHTAWGRPSGSLSGGERARAALALLSVRDTDVLVLDEPTNDLDLPGIEALEAALSASRACIVLASHDEALVRALAAEVCAIEAGALVRYRGGLDGYRRGARRLEPTAADRLHGLGEDRLDRPDAPHPPDATDAADAPATSTRTASTTSAERETALEAERRAAEAALEDPLRLSERALERWRERRANAEAALLAGWDASLPPPEPRFRTREAGLPVFADRDGEDLVVQLGDGPALKVRRIGSIAHASPLPPPDGAAERSVLPWAWRALCHGAARLALYLLPVEVVQVASREALDGGPFAPLDDTWWVARRADLERSEGWLRAPTAAAARGDVRSSERHGRQQRGKRRRRSRRGR